MSSRRTSDDLEFLSACVDSGRPAPAPPIAGAAAAAVSAAGALSAAAADISAAAVYKHLIAVAAAHSFDEHEAAAREDDADGRASLSLIDL